MGVGMAIVGLFGVGKEMPYSFEEHFVVQGIMLLSALLPAPLCLRLENKTFADLGLTLRGYVPDLWRGAWIASILLVVGFLLSLAMGAVEITDFQINLSSILASWFFFLLVALFEEIVVRGYVLGRLLNAGMNRFLALFLSSALFSALHLANPHVALLPLLNLWLAGVLLGGSYIYTRNLWLPISLHLFWNWIQGPLLGYSVSGQEIVVPTLTLRLSDNTLINGGEFGFEGSVLCTVLLAMAGILIVLRYSRHTQ